METTYAISLGNSKLGRLVIAALLEAEVAPARIVAIVRSPDRAQDLVRQGVDVRPASYDEDAAMVHALADVDRLYLISGMDGPEARIRQHRMIIAAAQANAVSRLVYTSFLDSADDSPFFAWSINRDTEAVLADSGLDYTVLRHGMYSEADLDYIPQYLEAGEVANNIGEGRISYISRWDLGQAGASCLLDEGHAGKTYEITGPEAMTQTEMALRLSQFTGRDLRYVQLSDEDYRRTFADAWGDVIVALYQSARMGNLERVTRDFERVVGRAPLTFAETHAKFYSSNSNRKAKA